MAIKSIELAAHIADYNAVTNGSASRFICPITLRECEENELINGHILCGKIIAAPRRTVIQYSAVDNYYGQTVEPTVIGFLNLPHLGPEERSGRSQKLAVTFPDGTEAAAFFGGGQAASVKFPAVDIYREGQFVATAHVQLPKNDSRVRAGRVELSRTDTFILAHLTAALVKSAYLAIFDMVGYQSVFSAWGDTVRRDLSTFFREGGGRDAAAKCFYAYRNAVKIFGGEPPQSWIGTSNTLADKTVLLHYTPGETMFAATCLFPVGDITLAVTLPQSVLGQDAWTAVDYYKRLMEDETAVPQFIARARFDGRLWQVEPVRRHVQYAQEMSASLKEVFHRRAGQ